MKKTILSLSIFFPLLINAQTSSTILPSKGQFYNSAVTGITGEFRTLNLGNTSHTLTAFTDGTGKAAFVGITNNTSSADAFEALTQGTGRAGYFEIDNSTSTNPALEAMTDGKGRAGYFRTINADNSAPVLEAIGNGGGFIGLFQSTNVENRNTVLHAKTAGLGTAGYFLVNNNANPSEAVKVEHNGSGIGISSNHFGTGIAGYFVNISSLNTSSAIYCKTNGNGATLVVNHGGSSGNLSVFQNNDVNMARIDKTGRGFFNGGTQNSGADIAEAFDVIGAANTYEAGDVLVIATSKNRTVEKSSKAYSTLVAGIYATKPGVLLTEENIDADLSDKVPMGVVGVIPTKVCGEGGEIHIGDMLVTSSRNGYAMKGNPKKIKIGQVLGKALEDFSGQSGKIKVLVSVR
jgi:hypothetical protein